MLDDWYVAIIDFGHSCCPFSGAGTELYRGFKKIAEERGITVVAEVFGVSREALARVNENGSLWRIADRVEAGEKLDTQKELEAVLANR